MVSGSTYARSNLCEGVRRVELGSMEMGLGHIIGQIIRSSAPPIPWPALGRFGKEVPSIVKTVKPERSDYVH